MLVFYVVDRPASYKILEPLMEKYPMGIMSHANTSRPVQKMLAKAPVVKICDCGAFTKEGVLHSYEELFEIYERMKAHYGLIIDYLKDAKRTIESAENALKIYKSGEYNFKLVAVLQGNTVKEYLNSLLSTLRLGYKYIAIGGLLSKVPNTARYVRTRENMWDVLRAVRAKYNGWLFALGCYHPKRHIRFVKLSIFGSDFKGWIFRYENTERRYEEVREWLLKNIYRRFYNNGKATTHLSMF